MRGDDGRLQQLRAVIVPQVSARDPLAAHYVQLAREASPLDIARQAYVDRETLRPLELTPRLEPPACVPSWRDGGPVPEEQKTAFAAWLGNITTRRLELSECERRLRTSMDAQWKLAQSEQESDRRMASAFKRWHLEHWGMADVPGPAPAGHDQPFETQLMAAVRRHAR